MPDVQPCKLALKLQFTNLYSAVNEHRNLQPVGAVSESGSLNVRLAFVVTKAPDFAPPIMR